MPRCKICKKTFQAYSFEPGKLSVINEHQFETAKSACSLCGAVAYTFHTTKNDSNKYFQLQPAGRTRQYH
jgi:hypothetical protein